MEEYKYQANWDKRWEEFLKEQELLSDGIMPSKPREEVKDFYTFMGMQVKDVASWYEPINEMRLLPLAVDRRCVPPAMHQELEDVNYFADSEIQGAEESDLELDDDSDEEDESDEETQLETFGESCYDEKSSQWYPA